MTSSPTRGLRHLALWVTDLRRSRAFYEGLLGMKEVWQPDADNLYLSGAGDNLALHQVPKAEVKNFQPRRGQFLDHFGFIMESPEAVDRMFEQIERQIDGYGGNIVQKPKRHRDDSYSFYMADPDGNVIQILFEPTISAMELVVRKQD